MNAILQQKDLSELPEEVRIDPDLTERMVRVSAAEAGAGIAARMDSDCNFMTRALRMGHSILVASTMAQAWSDKSPFGDLLANLIFSEKDEALSDVGRVMVAKIRKAARIPDPEISDSVLSLRFNQILAAI